MNIEEEKNSASDVASALPYYQTSQSQHDQWGQPPASYYAFFVVGNTLHGQLTGGTYAHSSEPPLAVPDLEFQKEIQAWEKASDEDAAKFEPEL